MWTYGKRRILLMNAVFFISMASLTADAAESSVVKEMAEPKSRAVDEVKSSETAQSASPTQTGEAVGMPNPVVQYPVFEDARNAVGFTPLYVPRKSGYRCDYIAVIDGNLAELRFSRKWEPEVRLTVRTYLRRQGEDVRDISGVYGAECRQETIGNVPVVTARLENRTYLAAWTVGEYTFSAMLEGAAYEAFRALLSDELLDLSVHYY